MSSPSATRSALIGAGRVGTAVTSLVATAGHEIVGVASRSPASAKKASARLGAPLFDLAETLPDAEVFLLGATDDGIADIATQLAGRLPEGAKVVHFSGALGIEVLAPLLTGFTTGHALHPVQSCPDVDSALRRLPGSAWGVTCSPGSEAWALALVEDDLAGHPILVPAEARPLWHAASVITANGLSALLAVGESLLAAIGIDEPDRVLGPLARGGLDNAAEGGGGARTLTGPFVRAEVDTVTRHLEALAQYPEQLDAYRQVATLIVAVAASAGRLSPEDASRMIKLVTG